MSVVYRTSLKNTRLSAVVTDIGATGKFIVGTATASQTIFFTWTPIYGWE